MASPPISRFLTIDSFSENTISKDVSISGMHANFGPPTVCHITYADGRVFQIDIHIKATGQDCLEKICKILGICEEYEYFGLQFYGGHNELLWVNLRNRLCPQMPRQPPFFLYFRVKYYVSPHILQLEETRHQFYLNVSHQLKVGTWTQDIRAELHGHLIALMAQVEFGNFNMTTMPCKYACFWPDCCGEIPSQVIRSTAEYHRSFTDKEKKHLEYELLSLASSQLDLYGSFFYEVKDCFKKRLNIGVTPDGIIIMDQDRAVLDRYPYTRIQQVEDRHRVVFLYLYNDDGTVNKVGYRLISRASATSLYRCVTEMRVFYRCDSVPVDLLNQSLTSSFFSSTRHGDRCDYAFDIRLTRRELYDTARRRLHSYSSTASCSSATTTSVMASHDVDSDNDPHSPINTDADLNVACFSPSIDKTDINRSSGRSNKSVSHNELAEIRNELERLRDAALCRICMDRATNRVLHPCGHAICCDECAELIEECPVCRQKIDSKNLFYAPWATELLIGKNRKKSCETASLPPRSPPQDRSHLLMEQSTATPPRQMIFCSTDNNVDNDVVVVVDNEITNTKQSHYPLLTSLSLPEVELATHSSSTTTATTNNNTSTIISPMPQTVAE